MAPKTIVDESDPTWTREFLLDPNVAFRTAASRAAIAGDREPWQSSRRCVRARWMRLQEHRASTKGKTVMPYGERE
jgi:hypothetical protein